MFGRDVEDESESRQWLDTKTRIFVAVGLLIVVTAALGIIDHLIKTHKTSQAVFGNVTKLDIAVGNGSVRLVPTTDEAVRVERKVDYTFRGPSLSQKVNGDTLVIRQNCSGLHVGQCDTQYVLAIPRAVSTTLKSSGGSVKVDGLQGSLDAQTSGGKIELQKTYGDLSLQTDSGQIVGKDLSSLRFASNTKGGKVNVAFAVAPAEVAVNTTDGDICVQVPKGNTLYRVDAGSVNSKSSINVKNDETSPRTIDARSENGKVEVTNG